MDREPPTPAPSSHASRDPADLARLAAGGDRTAAAELANVTYAELQRIAAAFFRHERADHTLQPTALVHEAFLRLVDQSRVDWQGRTHFLGVAAGEMRRILIDHARGRNAAKRGGGRQRVPLDPSLLPIDPARVDLLDLAAALERLAALDARQSQVVEMRFFSGMTVEEVAERLGLSPKTIEKDWRMARAWLVRSLAASQPDGDRT